MPPDSQQPNIPVNPQEQPAAPAFGGQPGVQQPILAMAPAPQPGIPQQQPLQPQNTKETAKSGLSTQSSLLISELRDGMAIMNDGSFRAVIACKSINFDLMSSREREGVEFSYQNFLNALYFPVQIFIRSQQVDIGPYLDRLEAIRRNQDNMLLNVLMDDYINFVDILAQEANIMDKSFFIVVPYFPEGDIAKIAEQSKGFFNALFSGNKTNKKITIDKVTYDKAKDEIKNRVDSVMSGLFQIGVKCVQLNTKELGELYYNMYNPDTAVREPLGDFENIATTFVKKGDGEAPRPHLQEGAV